LLATLVVSVAATLIIHRFWPSLLQRF